MNNSNNKANFGLSAFLFLLAIILIGFSIKQQFDSGKREEELSQKISQQVTQEVTEEVTKKVTQGVSGIIEQGLSRPSEFPDFDSLSRLKKLNIANNFESWTPAATVTEGKVKETIIIEKGELAKAYLYLKASLDGKALSKWESIYVKMNNEGGHLFRIQSLPVPSGEKTELLYTRLKSESNNRTRT